MQIKTLGHHNISVLCTISGYVALIAGRLYVGMKRLTHHRYLPRFLVNLFNVNIDIEIAVIRGADHGLVQEKTVKMFAGIIVTSPGLMVLLSDDPSIWFLRKSQLVRQQRVCLFVIDDAS